VGIGPLAEGLKGCDSAACWAAALTEISSAAVNINFQVRMTILSKFSKPKFLFGPICLRTRVSQPIALIPVAPSGPRNHSSVLKFFDQTNS
jgi:hypothetical protein